MSTTIQIKNSQVTSQPSTLATGELAYSEVSSTLFVGVSAPGVLAIGGPGLFAKIASPTFTGTPASVTPASSDNSTAIATTAYVKAQSYLTANQTITVAGDATGSGTTAITLTLASVVSANTYTKVTVNAKGLVTTGTTLSAGDIPSLTHTAISDFLSTVYAVRLDQLAAPTASVSWNSQSLTNLAAPVNPADAATKSYVDASSQGLTIKPACQCASTGNLTLSGLQAIDSYTTLAADRVLVKNQTTTTQNGIYAAASGAWARTNDFAAADSNGVVSALPGSFAFVENGTVNGSTGWVCNNSTAITIGTTAVSFAQFSGSGTYTAGNGLGLSGGQFTATSANTAHITVSGSGIDIASTYVGQASITTLGTVTTGTIVGGTF